MKEKNFNLIVADAIFDVILQHKITNPDKIIIALDVFKHSLIEYSYGGK